MLFKEDWRDIKGYAGYYQVSSHGRVASLARVIKEWDPRWGKWRTKYLKYRVLRPGGGLYLSVLLSKNGLQKTYEVHRLVMNTFVGLKPEDKEVCHNDGNRKNNRLDNLRYDTRSNNHKDKITHGTAPIGEKSASAKLTSEDVKLIKQIYAQGESSQSNIANRFGVGQSTISAVIRSVRYTNVV